MASRDTFHFGNPQYNVVTVLIFLVCTSWNTGQRDYFSVQPFLTTTLVFIFLFSIHFVQYFLETYMTCPNLFFCNLQISLTPVALDWHKPNNTQINRILTKNKQFTWQKWNIHFKYLMNMHTFFKYWRDHRGVCP